MGNKLNNYKSKSSFHTILFCNHATFISKSTPNSWLQFIISQKTFHYNTLICRTHTRRLWKIHFFDFNVIPGEIHITI